MLRFEEFVEKGCSVCLLQRSVGRPWICHSAQMIDYNKVEWGGWLISIGD
jgi:hypothetical protein